MLDRKGSVHEGGIRVPCFVRWPGTLEPGRVVEPVAAHIDLTPTLLEACGVAKPEAVAFDGRSLLPLLRGEPVDWPDRTLYFQWHRGDVPELHRAFAARSGRYKLGPAEGGRADSRCPDRSHYELYDMVADPLEQTDIAAEQPEVVAAMLRDMKPGSAMSRVDPELRPAPDPPRLARRGPGDPDPPGLARRGDRLGARRDGRLGGRGRPTRRVRPRSHLRRGPARTVHARTGGDLGQTREIGPDTRTCRIEGIELPTGPGRSGPGSTAPDGAVGALSGRDPSTGTNELKD